jgi:type IV secretory pathway protease TraF
MMRDPPGFNLNWLLKRVQGVGGDRFCWRASEMRHYVNDRPMPVIPQQALDAGIPIWRGCRSLMADEVVGFGEHVLAYGSQYLGPVRLAQLWGVYQRWE